MSTLYKHCQLNTKTALRFFITLFILSMAFSVNAANLFNEQKPVIVIDPGHGGYNSGVKGPGASMEKDITLALAHLLKNELSEKFLPILTRTDDYDIEVQNRTSIANQKSASVFISIHTGGSFQHKTSGISIYYFQNPSSSVFSSSQTYSDSFEEDETFRLWNNIQVPHITESKELAQTIQSSLSGQTYFGIKKSQGGKFSVLTGADMPAIIIEAGYLTNPSDENNLNDIDILKELSQKISKGVEEYLSK